MKHVAQEMKQYASENLYINSHKQPINNYIKHLNGDIRLMFLMTLYDNKLRISRQGQRPDRDLIAVARAAFGIPATAWVSPVDSFHGWHRVSIHWPRQKPENKQLSLFEEIV